MADTKFNEHITFDKALILMAVGNKATQDVIHEYSDGFNKKDTITFDQWCEKIDDLWAANFPRVTRYDVERFIDKVLYHEGVLEECEELPIRISVGNRYLEIPMNPITQGALEEALKRFSTAVITKR